MEIILNTELKPRLIEPWSADGALSRLANRTVANRSEGRYIAILPPQDFKTRLDNFGLIGLLSHAYSNHRKVVINPHDVWGLLIGDLSRYINSHVETFRKLFTDSNEKKLLTVPTGDVMELPLGAMAGVLTRNVKFNATLLMPVFSTVSVIHIEFFQALMCDMASAYYSYGTFLCGIPAIRVAGKKTDWTMLVDCYTRLADIFSRHDPSLEPAFDRILATLAPIVSSFDSDQTEHWRNIFTQKNIGSGGELKIDGWITKLFIEKRDLPKINNFMTDTAFVKYQNLETGRNFGLLMGGLDFTNGADDFIELQYSKQVFELMTPDV